MEFSIQKLLASFHKTHWLSELRHEPRWGAYYASPDPLIGISPAPCAIDSRTYNFVRSILWMLSPKGLQPFKYNLNPETKFLDTGRYFYFKM
jgi:hypothetical protein